MAKRKTAEEAEAITDLTETVNTAGEKEPNADPLPTPKTEENQHSSEKLIYVGASRDGIAEGTVFCGKIPEALNKPYLRELCIDVNKLGQFKKRSAVTTSREAFLLRKSREI